jgi:hypothetical protein
MVALTLVFTALGALVALFAFIWNRFDRRRGLGHRLYIPKTSGRPGDPNFEIRKVIDDYELGGLNVGIVWISGRIRNAGPREARSVEIIGRGSYRRAERKRQHDPSLRQDVEDTFRGCGNAMRNGDSTPMLKPNEEVEFIVAGLYKPTDPNFALLKDGSWFRERRGPLRPARQVHPVHACSKPAEGWRRKSWDPQDLCDS